MNKSDNSVLVPEIADFVLESEKAYDGIAQERKALLEKIALYVRSRTSANKDARLTFICTHNSRRSQTAQIWAQTAAAYYGVPGVLAFSGGTEATAFEPRAVAALRRAGFTVEKTGDDRNPIYSVRFADTRPGITVFSKVYDTAPNPAGGYCAVMTCSQADSNCPVVPGAELRVALPYEDPKLFDGTDQETAKYDERCRQIGTEMLYLFKLVRQWMAGSSRV
jgi:hypothetical protein